MSRDYYAKQHLPGAIALVEADVEALAPRLLPDRSAAIVTYCSNPACANSQRVAEKLTVLCYTNVRKYREGIEDWVSAGLPVESGATARRHGLTPGYETRCTRPAGRGRVRHPARPPVSRHPPAGMPG